MSNRDMCREGLTPWNFNVYWSNEIGSRHLAHTDRDNTATTRRVAVFRVAISDGKEGLL
jgi:hypothetical protein